MGTVELTTVTDRFVKKSLNQVLTENSRGYKIKLKLLRLKLYLSTHSNDCQPLIKVMYLFIL